MAAASPYRSTSSRLLPAGYRFAPFSSPFLAFSALLAAPGGSLEGEGRSAEAQRHRTNRTLAGRPAGVFDFDRRPRTVGPGSTEDATTMAMTKGDGATGPRAGSGATRAPGAAERARSAEPAPPSAQAAGDAGAAPVTAPASRRSHVPGAGTPAADAVERARREMLHEGSRTHQDAADRRERRARIGADVVCEAILRQDVDVLFGYPGGVILPLYDVLGDHPALRHVLVRHEQGAAHAADGYARATGKVGVCLGTSGPAATNLVTGIATAQLDSVPMVAITGNVDCDLWGRDAFQETDIIGITMPITKHSFMVRDVNQLAA